MSPLRKLLWGICALANPPGEEIIAVGDSLIIMGTKEQLASLERICEGVKSNE